MKQLRSLLAELLSVAILAASSPLAPLALSPVKEADAMLSSETALTAYHLMTDELSDPIGIDDACPTFSWRLASDGIGQYQSAYRIRVADSEAALPDGALVWDSGKVTSDDTLGIRYAGDALRPRTRYYWNVTVTDKDGASTTSKTASFETGLMDAGFENAKWITRGEPTGGALYHDKTFTIDFDYQIVAGAASFVFGASDKSNLYFWQINILPAVTGGTTLLRPHSCVSGNFNCLSNVTMYGDSSKVTSGMAHMQIAVDNGVIKTYADGKLVETRTVSPFELGYIGIRRADAEHFFLDNVVVRGADGSVIVNADFENGSFGFNKGTVANGKLEVSTSVSAGVYLRTEIGAGRKESAPLFRKSFTVDESKTVKSARLYATSAGIYECTLNGSRVSDTYLNPGLTAYDDHLLYQTYDITPFLAEGENVITATVGLGWYMSVNVTYGSNPSFLGKIVVDYTDGTSLTVDTDESWRFNRFGPVLFNSYYDGYTYDARIEREDLAGFMNPGYDDDRWDYAAPIATNRLFSNSKYPKLVGQNIAPIRGKYVLEAKSVNEVSDGVFIYDFGQNIAGVCRVTATEPRGTTMVLRHAEMLNLENMKGADGAPGTLFRGSLKNSAGTAESTDTYIFAGDENGETFEPKMTYHGFRYVEITGLDHALPLKDVKAVLLMTDLEQTGTFESSDAMVNQLYSNSVFSARDNFLSVPTDCPQRKERYGWTGDAQIFTRTGSYMMDIDAFYRKYMMDIRDSATVMSNDRIAIADVSPACCGNAWYGQGDRNEATNGWGDAIVIIPYQIYKQYGDKKVLEENYTYMKGWINYLVSTSGADYIRDKSWTGDWLPVGETKSPIGLTDTAFCAYSALLLSEIADVLGKTEDSDGYHMLYENYRAAWQREYLNADGASTKCGTQTSYVLGLKFGLFDADKTAAAAENLVKNIKGRGYHLSTGFLGLSFLNPMLSENGYDGVAFKLLEQKEFPSWLYSVSCGSTTIWESWDTFRLYNDGTSAASNNSLNHFSYGAVSEWLYRYVLGIERDDANKNAVAFKHFFLKPTFGGTIKSASGSYESVRGTIRSAWRLDGDSFSYTCTVPAGTTATLYLPALADSAVNTGEGITYVGFADGAQIYTLKSGSYAFLSTVDPGTNTVTTVKVDNYAKVPATVTVGDESTDIFVKTFSAGNALTANVSGVAKNYEFLYFEDEAGTTYPNGTTFFGDNAVKAVFAYAPTASGSGSKKLSLTGDEGVTVFVNGTEYPLPYEGTFAAGTLVTLAVGAVPFGKEQDGFDAFLDTGFVRMNANISAAAKIKNERVREGYDIFFDFKENIDGWSGSNAALTYEPDYMRFKSVRKSDGSFDPRAVYDFTSGSGSITRGKYLPAADYTDLVIGFIAESVKADNTPVMYISTEAEPNYVSPVRQRGSSDRITTDYADGVTLHEITYPLSNWSAWTGNIKQIYLDILDNVDGDLLVDYIRFKHRDLRLTVSSFAGDAGTTYTYTPGSSVDLSEIPVDEGFLGFTTFPGSEDYITTLTLKNDTTIYANYENARLSHYEWSFDTDDDAEGWSAENAASAAVKDGAYRLGYSASAADAQITLNDIAIKADLYRYIIVRMRHTVPEALFGSDPMQLLFTTSDGTWSSDRMAVIEQLPASDAYQTYIIDVTACPNWTGTVTALRLVPFAVSSPDDTMYAEIDSISLVPQASFTVDFANGSAPVTTVVPTYEPIDMSTYGTPTREGYNFLGWTNEYGLLVTVVTPIADTVITAAWEQKPYMVWDFDDNTEQGWKFTNVASKRFEDGVLEVDFSTSNADLWVYHEKLGVNASLFKYVVVDMQHNIPAGSYGSKPFEVFFCRTTDSPWQQHLSVNTAQKASGSGFTRYIIDMSKNTNWNKTVDYLRIDPFEIKSPSGSPYTLRIDRIALCGDVTVTIDGKTMTVPAGLPLDLDSYEPASRTGYIFRGFRIDGSDEIVTSVIPEKDMTLTSVFDRSDVIEWNFDNGADGWDAVNATAASANGTLTLTHSTTNADAWLRLQSTAVDAEYYRYMVIRCRHNFAAGAFGSKSAEVFFTRTTDTPWQQHLSVSTTQKATDAFVPYVIDMKKCTYWNGIVNRLRIDMFEKTSDAAVKRFVEFDSIRLYHDICLDTEYTYKDGTFEAVTALVGMPDGTQVVAAGYDADGRMIAVSGVKSAGGMAALRLSGTCKTIRIFALDGKQKPLCEPQIFKF